MSLRIVRHLLPILITISPLVLKAQQRHTTLDTLQVTAQRPLSQAGLHQTTLDTTILHHSISLTLSDILAQATPLYVKSYGRATESTAEFRGTSPSHTQVTWNGIRINSPMLGTVDFSYIPGHFVDQATLLYGASSLTATAGALGGAICLATQPRWAQGSTLQYTQGVGSYHTWDQYLRLTHSTDTWSTDTRLSYGHSLNDFHYTNYDKKTDVWDSEGQLQDSYHPREKNRSGYFDDIHLMQQLAHRDNHGNQFSAALWYTHSLRGLPFLSVDYKDDSHFVNEHRHDALRSHLTWQHTASRWASILRAGHIYQDHHYDYYTQGPTLSTDITHSQSRVHTTLLQGQWRFVPNEQWVLTLDAQAYCHQVISQDHSPYHIGLNYDRRRIEESFSAQTQWQATSRLSLSAVIRQEIYGQRAIAPIPALYAHYQLHRPSHLTFRLSVARNYRFPSMDDLYFQPGGNPLLRPEKGITYDASLQCNLARRRWTLQGSATAFDSHITDWILWTPNHRGYWVPSNVRRVHNYGLELMANSQLHLGRHWLLTLNGNFAFTPSINQGQPLNDNDASYGRQLCYVPRRSANLRAQLTFQQWSLTYQWVHYSQRYTTTSNEVDLVTGSLRPYYMSDVGLERRFAWRWMQATLRIQVDNLLGTEYVTVLSRPMPGRHFEVYLDLRPRLAKRKKPIPQ